MRNVKYKGKVITLVTRKRIFPNGYVSRVEIIEHPGAVVIVPFLDLSTVILLKQYRPAIDRYLYELPAGTLKPGESVPLCARRELIEETGFAARKFRRMGQIYPVPGYSTEIMTVFKAEGLYPREAEGDPDELIETRTFSRVQVRRLFRNGKIKDAKTICGLAFCGWLN